MIDLFQYAEYRRDQALERVETKAGEDWNEYALKLIAQVANDKTEFISDDIMNAMQQKPHDPRALGPAMKRAQSLGIIEPTQNFRPSLRRHLSPVRVWRKVKQ